MQKMEPEPPILTVECRDGIAARVQRVPYEGTGGGVITFGHRTHPVLPRYDESGDRNEGPDIWYQDGHWLENMQSHPFDIIRIIKVTAAALTPVQSHA